MSYTKAQLEQKLVEASTLLEEAMHTAKRNEELVLENRQLRALLSDALHQNKVDAGKIKRFKNLERFGVPGGVLPRPAAMGLAKDLAKSLGTSTRVTNGIVEVRNADGSWVTADGSHIDGRRS